jgi:uroporphyrin-III C-methyltransferase
MHRTERHTGKVFLVGAGPGDPELLTRKAERIINEAEVVLYDKLVDERVLAFIPKKAKRIDVGKKPSHHKVPQYAINELMSRYAQAGKTVVRLKGGDPYIFGRGGEEAEELVAHGITVEVVPGISSAVAVPAYAGIPVTHREHASTLTIITGHEAAGNELQWDVLAQLKGTLVILMGVGTLQKNVANLLASGKPEKTPAAVISQGTTPDQKVVVGTLDTIGREADRAGVEAPAVMIIGDVVKLRDVLASKNGNSGNHST